MSNFTNETVKNKIFPQKLDFLLCSWYSVIEAMLHGSFMLSLSSFLALHKEAIDRKGFLVQKSKDKAACLHDSKI